MITSQKWRDIAARRLRRARQEVAVALPLMRGYYLGKLHGAIYALMDTAPDSETRAQLSRIAWLENLKRR